MKNWMTRLIALSFVLSLFAMPQAAIMAEDAPAATPVVGEQEDPATPASELETPAGDESGTPEPQSMNRGGVQPLAALSDNYGLAAGSWDETSGLFTLDLVFFTGFTAVTGDTIEMFYTSDSISIGPGPHSVDNAPMTVTVNPAQETITLTFTADFTPTDIPIHTAEISLDADMNFPACRPTETGYTSTADVLFTAGSYYPLSVQVDGPVCPISDGAQVDDLIFVPAMQAIQLSISGTPNEDLAGTQLTITYPADILTMDPGPVDFYSMGMNGLGPVIATAVASNGVITITFVDDIEIGSERVWGIGYMGATISTSTCDPDGGIYALEVGRLVMVASPGGTFTEYLPSVTEGGFRNTILCNGAPASKSGVISEDGSQFHWTIDTGHLLNVATISEGIVLNSGAFLCDSIVVTPVTPNTDFEIDCFEEGMYGFEVYLYGDGPVRATITFSTTVSEEVPELSYLNCAVISAGGEPELTMARSVETAGVAGLVCAEVFPNDGGDSISNVVSATEVYQGDELTFNVTFSTTSFLWWSISLDDVLPAGVDVTDVTCTFAPVGLEEGECEVLDDNTISVGMRRTDTGSTPTDAGTITLVITGEVTAAPGTELVSEACGERKVDVPGLTPIYSQFGSGQMCASTSTMVLQVPSTVTPEPSPTATLPATPDASPTMPATPDASPTAPVTPDPTATTAPVTSLPETGTSGTGSSGMVALLTALAAGVMLASVAGLRIRGVRR